MGRKPAPRASGPSGQEICPGCQESKPLNAFTSQGRQCKSCKYAVVKAWREKNRARFYATNTVARRKNPEKERERHQTYRLKNAERIRVSTALYRLKNAEKERERNKASYRQNREKHRIRAKAYYMKNTEKMRRLSRAWQRQNHAKYLENIHVWNRNNPEKRQAMSQRYRARKRHAAINDFTAAQWREMLDAYDHRCVYCRRKMKRLSQDHITPLVAGGNHTKSNIVPACQSCNSKKGKGPPLVPVQPLLL